MAMAMAVLRSVGETAAVAASRGGQTRGQGGANSLVLAALPPMAPPPFWAISGDSLCAQRSCRNLQSRCACHEAQADRVEEVVLGCSDQSLRAQERLGCGDQTQLG